MQQRNHGAVICNMKSRTLRAPFFQGLAKKFLSLTGEDVFSRTGADKTLIKVLLAEPRTGGKQLSYS